MFSLPYPYAANVEEGTSLIIYMDDSMHHSLIPATNFPHLDDYLLAHIFLISVI